MKISQQILDLVPYQPGKPISEAQREYNLSKVVKLASNENPMGTSPKVLEAIEKTLREIHRYPDPSCFSLLEELSSSWKIPKTHLAIGNGSNEVIDLLIRIYCAPNQAILLSQASFVAYEVCAQAARVEQIKVPMKADLHPDIEAFKKILRDSKRSENIQIIFLPNPNNPTGVLIPQQEIVDFVEEFGKDDRRLIVFDEAYHEFVRDPKYRSAVELMSKSKQVIVLRTMSKAYGLAGLRIGVLIADPSIIDLFNRVRNPFNVNELAQAAGVAALRDKKFVQDVVAMTHRGLDKTYDYLSSLKLPFIESQGNFVMFDTLRDSRQVNEALLRQGVILRPVRNYGFNSHLRMSIGLPEENEAALKALAAVLKEIPLTKK